jgi:hypothetical protein
VLSTSQMVESTFSPAHLIDCVFRAISDTDSDSIRTGFRFKADSVPI